MSEDLVPYYRPGCTEPDMVPRDSVPGTEAVAQGVITGDKAEAAPEPKKSAKKAARPAAKKR